ncbi:MAG: heparinase II/III family protein [Candidatus Hydrogenedentes bacterium]|nr:heparinase II/III family protein [Candidatus Hydrogenedentota bacterium]
MRVLCIISIFCPVFALAQDAPADRKAEYVHAVTRGAGMLPWQEAAPSETETAFRAEIEARKDALLANSAAVSHPILYTPEDLARAKANAAAREWGQGWVDNQLSLADYVIAQPAGWIDAMIPEETPSHGYGFTCPNCVGEQSQEAVGYSLFSWDYKHPDIITCRACGQVYPDARFPETAELNMPRTGERITYFLNEAERAQPEDRSGKLAWHWVGYPIHVSFTGIIREQKIGLMRTAAQSLAFAWAFTGDVRYAEAAREVLVRYAKCYRNWLYRDYWDTYADCDPLYAAYHDMNLPLEWKRHLCEDAFEDDTVEKARMRQTYWGAGRVHPSTDSISGLPALALAYDLTCTAMREDGTAVWSAEDRRLVERDLLLEYLMGAEPYVGGPGKAESPNNKAPRIYNAMASIAKCLGIAAFADTALKGYERVRDDSFEFDGFSTESPSYNNMYLAQLLVIPETLHGFAWPADYSGRSGVVDYYASDPLLRLMYRGVLWSLLPSGHYLPLSDTHVHTHPSDIIVHQGLRRYPDLFARTLPRLGASSMSEYALFNLAEEALQEDTGLTLPETLFPAWQTAILRQGEGPQATTLTLAFNPPGGHRHYDNLALYYDAHGRGILGDHGYVGDMPINSWIKSTESHNLVIVDDKGQKHDGREPQFELMATSPLASVVEASSNAYKQCSEYRRRVILVKGPDGRSFAVDIFRVKGGRKHAFRVYSEIAASDSENGALAFTGIDMPDEAPLPDVGASLARDDIFGLRDVRSAQPAQAWQATWQDASGAYRLWMLSKADRVEASNGPGQRSLEEPARRVRYVDAVREGEGLASTFVALHEPIPAGGEGAIANAEHIEVPEAGPNAVAVRVKTLFGDWLILNDFDTPTEVDGVRFQGAFALLKLDASAKAYMTIAAHLLDGENLHLDDAQPLLIGAIAATDGDHLAVQDAPATWPACDTGATAWLRLHTPQGWTGYPVAAAEGNTVTVKDYPLVESDTFELPAVRYAVFE